MLAHLFQCSSLPIKVSILIKVHLRDAQPRSIVTISRTATSVVVGSWLVMTLSNPRGFLAESFPTYCTLLYTIMIIVVDTIHGISWLVSYHISPPLSLKKPLSGHLAKFLYILPRVLKSLVASCCISCICPGIEMITAFNGGVAATSTLPTSNVHLYCVSYWSLKVCGTSNICMLCRVHQSSILLWSFQHCLSPECV